MKILLDNCVSYEMKRFFASHLVAHAIDIGCDKLANGQLIAIASKQLDVLVTTEKKMRHEHNLSILPISILELNTHFTRIQDLESLRPFLESVLAEFVQFRFVSVRPDGSIERLAPRTT